MRTLVDQLYGAYCRLGWSMSELLRRSGLDLDRSTLRRKLIGETPMSTREAEALARAMGVTLVFLPDAETGALLA